MVFEGPFVSDSDAAHLCLTNLSTSETLLRSLLRVCSHLKFGCLSVENVRRRERRVAYAYVPNYDGKYCNNEGEKSGMVEHSVLFKVASCDIVSCFSFVCLWSMLLSYFTWTAPGFFWKWTGTHFSTCLVHTRVRMAAFTLIQMNCFNIEIAPRTHPKKTS